MCRRWDCGNEWRIARKTAEPCTVTRPRPTLNLCGRGSDLHLLRHGHCCISAPFLAARAGPLAAPQERSKGFGGNSVESKSVTKRAGENFGTSLRSLLPTYHSYNSPGYVHCCRITGTGEKGCSSLAGIITFWFEHSFCCVSSACMQNTGSPTTLSIWLLSLGAFSPRRLVVPAWWRPPHPSRRSQGVHDVGSRWFPRTWSSVWDLEHALAAASPQCQQAICAAIGTRYERAWMPVIARQVSFESDLSQMGCKPAKRPLAPSKPTTPNRDISPCH